MKEKQMLFLHFEPSFQILELIIEIVSTIEIR
jgi:hypothetical protein